MNVLDVILRSQAEPIPPLNTTQQALVADTATLLARRSALKSLFATLQVSEFEDDPNSAEDKNWYFYQKHLEDKDSKISSSYRSHPDLKDDLNLMFGHAAASLNDRTATV